jgi:hypothetical protein
MRLLWSSGLKLEGIRKSNVTLHTHFISVDMTCGIDFIERKKIALS